MEFLIVVLSSDLTQGQQFRLHMSQNSEMQFWGRLLPNSFFASWILQQNMGTIMIGHNESNHI